MFEGSRCPAPIIALGLASLCGRPSDLLWPPTSGCRQNPASLGLGKRRGGLIPSPAQDIVLPLLLSTRHPWRLLTLEYIAMLSPFSKTRAIASNARCLINCRGPLTNKDSRASLHFLCPWIIVSLDSSSIVETSSERRWKQR